MAILANFVAVLGNFDLATLEVESKTRAASRLGQNRKSCPFFDQNIVNNNDVIYGHCVDGQKFYVVKKGQKSDKFSVF